MKKQCIGSIETLINNLNSIINFLYVEYIVDFMTLNPKDRVIFVYKLTAQLITLLHMIEFHFLHWKVLVFFLMYIKFHYKSVVCILGGCIHILTVPQEVLLAELHYINKTQRQQRC